MNTYQSFNSERGDHYFLVQIDKQLSSTVTITENYARLDPDLPPVISDVIRPRVIINKQKWDMIAPVLRHEFNERLKKMGKKAGRWEAGFNEVSRIFGKEMVVLAWAIEETQIDNIPIAVQNWLGLTPEERWWLYTQANAATGHAEKGRGKGWRKAIEVALTQNPTTVSDFSTSYRNTDELRKHLTIS